MVLAPLVWCGSAAAVALSENFDGVVAPALPAGWSQTGSPPWATSAAAPFSPPNSAFVTDAPFVSDTSLVSPVFVPMGPSRLYFQNYVNTEGTPTGAYDAGVLEIKIGSGAFVDILAAGGRFVTGEYNRIIVPGNPLVGRRGWAANSGGYFRTTAILPAAASGQNVQLRWRMATDSSAGRPGWRIDDVVVGTPQSLPGAVTSMTSWGLRDTLTSGAATTSFSFGAPPALVPLTGDWNADGETTPAYFQNGTFSQSDTNAAGPPGLSFAFGDPRGFPVSGDFNGDSRDDVAVFRNGSWELRIAPGPTPLPTFTFGSGSWPSVIPVAGDWDGDGTDGIGFYCRVAVSGCPAGTWNLRNVPTGSGPADLTFAYSPGTDAYPVVGDWDADGTDTVGVKNATTPATWQLNNANDGGAPDVTFTFGGANDLPVVWAQLR